MTNRTREFSPLASSLLWRRALLLPLLAWPWAIFVLHQAFEDWGLVGLGWLVGAVAGSAFGLVVDDSRGGRALDPGLARVALVAIVVTTTFLVTRLLAYNAVAAVAGVLMTFGTSIFVLPSLLELWRRRREAAEALP